MKFKFFIGGFYNGHFEIILKKENLICFISNYPLNPLEPTHTFSIVEDTDWEILVQYLRTLQWKSFYEAGMYDGTQWTLEFKTEEINIKSYGSNAYPKGFKKLLRLLNNITEKHRIHKKFVTIP
ncbi:MAG: hypothetical protein WKF35_13745 [Ferruginibacter sp.]